MLESFNTRNEMQYQRLTEEEKQKRGILGRLVGIIADFKNSTRNGRRYTEELWDKTFNDPIVKEKLENRCILGELGHPVDRQETDIEKVAICLAEFPKKGDDGKLHGVFDILDTPNGRILKTLCDYGCNIGVSSRGGGDTYEDYNGNETVDADTYEFECWDAVLLPAVKSARPAYVNESFDTSKRTLKTALLEAMQNSSEEEKEVMKNTLETLNIDYSAEEETTESADNIEVEATDDTAINDGVETNLVSELQEALQKQQELETQIESLQKKLSVCYTKESRYSDRLMKANARVAQLESLQETFEDRVTTLTEQVKRVEETNQQLTETVQKLEESVNEKDSKLAQANESLKGYRERYSDIKTKLDEATSRKTKLNESLSTRETEYKKLTESFNQLKVSLNEELEKSRVQVKEAEKANQKLTEELQEYKKDIQIIQSRATAQTENGKQLVEKYKAIAKTAVDKYIASQAHSIGVSPSDIKSRLNESYSFKDIDKTIEDLKQYRLNLNSLPFTTLEARKPAKARISEIKESLIERKSASSFNADDDVDDSLLTFTN